MNYISHLTGFFLRVSEDFRLNPTHVSLYMALFQQWNLNRFRNPISIARGEVMGISKISSRVTYHKCIRELHGWGYIHYEPSYNHFRGSLVFMLGFGEKEKQASSGRPDQLKFRTGAEPGLDPACTGHERELVPLINNTNSKNMLKEGNRRTPLPELGMDLEKKGQSKEKGCGEKEKKEEGPLPPGLGEVRAFFEGRGQPEKEALKFFHHYQANGWLVGRVPMQDWVSSARKWILNSLDFKAHADHRGNDTGGDAEPGAGGRDYSEGL